MRSYTTVTMSKANRAWLREIQLKLARDRGLSASKETIDEVIAYLRLMYYDYLRRVAAEEEQGGTGTSAPPPGLLAARLPGDERPKSGQGDDQAPAAQLGNGPPHGAERHAVLCG